MLSVVAYGIFRNERKNAEAWAKSLQEADAVYALDTGSTDNTPEILKDNGVQIFFWETVQDLSAPNAFRFDTARNRLLDLIPASIDVCVVCDFDERFRAGWREALEKSWTPETTHGRYEYNQYHDGVLKCTNIIAYTQEKALSGFMPRMSTRYLTGQTATPICQEWC